MTSYITRILPNLRRSRKDLCIFLDLLSATCGKSAIFGGALRDWHRYNRVGQENDIDIVVDCEHGMLKSFMEEHIDSYSINKYGGFRFSVGKSTNIDMWRAQETWAIRENLIHYDGLESLLKTTFFSVDAALYVWPQIQGSKGSYILDHLVSSEIEIVLKENPDPIACASRSIRFMYQGYNLSDELFDFTKEIALLYRDELTYRTSQLLQNKKASVWFVDNLVKYQNNLHNPIQLELPFSSYQLTTR